MREGSPPPPVPCHAMCHMSYVTCHMLHVIYIYIFFTQWLSLFVEGPLSRGLPRLLLLRLVNLIYLIYAYTSYQALEVLLTFSLDNTSSL